MSQIDEEIQEQDWCKIFPQCLSFFIELENNEKKMMGRFKITKSNLDYMKRYIKYQDELHEQFLFHGNIIKVAKMELIQDYIRYSIPDFNGDQTYIQNIIQRPKVDLVKETTSGYYKLSCFIDIDRNGKLSKSFSDMIQQKEQKIIFVFQYLAQVYKVLSQNGFLLDTQPNLTNFIIHWDQKHQLPVLILIPTFTVISQYQLKNQIDELKAYSSYLQIHERHFGYLLNNICLLFLEDWYDSKIEQFYQEKKYIYDLQGGYKDRFEVTYQSMVDVIQYDTIERFFGPQNNYEKKLQFTSYWLIKQIDLQIKNFKVYFDLRCKYYKCLLHSQILLMNDQILNIFLNLLQEENTHIIEGEENNVPNKAEFIMKLFKIFEESLKYKNKSSKFLLTKFQRQFDKPSLIKNFNFKVIKEFQKIIDLKEHSLVSLKADQNQNIQSQQQQQTQNAPEYRCLLSYTQSNETKSQGNKQTSQGTQSVLMDKKHILIEYLEQKNCLVVKSSIENITMSVDQGDDLVALIQNLMYQEGYVNIYFNDKRQLTIQHSICTGSPIYLVQNLIQMIDMQIIITIGILEIYNTKINLGRSTKDYRFKLIVPEIIHYLRDYERQSNEFFDGLRDNIQKRDFQSLFLPV